MQELLTRVAAVWIIIVGAGILIIPGRPPQCIVCGDGFNLLIGVISVVLGAAVLVNGFRPKAKALA